ncbi:transposase, partial [Methylibium sp.]|uniref:transposase n=1 Tax=Methylibium sp. TaxID=2067992 RepID=UPI0025DB4C71
MKQTTILAASSQKVRRDVMGGKRGDGHERDQRISRPSGRSIRRGRPDPNLTGVAGLVPFGAYLEEIGVDRELRRAFFELKDGPMVVYPMETQMRMLIDAFAVGEQRVFGLESLAADPLFVKLAGGVVPSIDTVYRDLARFDEMENAKLELIMASHGLATLAELTTPQPYVHVDIDTTVEPLFGQQEGALPGYNPRYRGRNSYHPILAAIAETGACIGARLRPGDVGLGGDDAKLIQTYVKRAVAHAPRGRMVVARIDSGADC